MSALLFFSLYLQVKPKHPDFKRKDGVTSLWLDSAPKCVLSELGGQQLDVPTQNSKSKQVNELKGIVKLFSLRCL